MKRLEVIFHETNGFKDPEYLEIYETLFAQMRYERIRLLELGIFNGGSLKAWAEYFPYAQIAGIDLKPPTLSEELDRIRMYAADQADVAALSRIAEEVAPDGFDIIIDDCSHVAKATKVSFWNLFNNHLKPDGIYCIEDWSTGYWPWWPDGRRVVVEPDTQRRMPSHDAGMVGFLKQLIDEFHPAASDETPEQLYASLPWPGGGQGSLTAKKSIFESITLYSDICAIRKARSTVAKLAGTS